MGTFSISGGEGFDRIVEADLHAICVQLKNPHVEAIILVGAPARGEGTPFEGKPFNDYDIVVIAREKIKLEPIRLYLPVEISVKTRDELASAPCTLFNYEMRYGHKIIFGPENILDIMPPWKKEDIPLLEGTRLLVNRGSLHLLDENFKYLMKLVLSMGDASYLAMKCHEISYQEKLSSFRQNSKSWSIPGADFLSSLYEKAIRFKLYGQKPLLAIDEWATTLRYFEQFALWYEGIRLEKTFETLEEYEYTLRKSPFSLYNIAQNLLYFRSLRNSSAPVAAKLLLRLLFLARGDSTSMSKEHYLAIWRRYA